MGFTADDEWADIAILTATLGALAGVAVLQAVPQRYVLVTIWTGV